MTETDIDRTVLAELSDPVPTPKKPPRKPRPSELAKKAAKAAGKKVTKPKKAKKAKVVKHRTPKAKKLPSGPARSHRLDLRLTKSEKAKLTAKAKAARRTITSIVIELIEKLK